MRTFFTDIRGITIVEMLIASFMSLLVAGASLHFYLSQHQSWLAQNDVSDVQQNARATLDEIADAVCKVYKTGKALLQSRGNNTRKARNAFIFIARDRAGASLKSVASYLRLRTFGTISRVVKKSRIKIARSKDFRRLIIKAESHLHKKANKGV